MRSRASFPGYFCPTFPLILPILSFNGNAISTLLISLPSVLSYASLNGNQANDTYHRHYLSTYSMAKMTQLSMHLYHQIFRTLPPMAKSSTSLSIYAIRIVSHLIPMVITWRNKNRTKTEQNRTKTKMFLQKPWQYAILSSSEFTGIV